MLLEPSNPSNESLKKATELIDSLQLAELDNFLRCNLSAEQQRNSGNENNKEVDSKAAIFSTILLKNRLEVVLQLPNEKLISHQINIPIKDIENTLDNLRQELEEDYLPEEGTSLTKVVYDWLIKPFEKSLKQKGIDTLVFILDGSLRNIPMSTLSSDGKHYLIEDYAIALTPSLNIPKSHNIKDIELQALIFGLSKTNPDSPDHQNFPNLDYVNKEVKDIEEQIPHQTFQDDKFKINNLRKYIIIIYVQYICVFSLKCRNQPMILRQVQDSRDGKRSAYNVCTSKAYNFLEFFNCWHSGYWFQSFFETLLGEANCTYYNWYSRCLHSPHSCNFYFKVFVFDDFSSSFMDTFLSDGTVMSIMIQVLFSLFLMIMSGRLALISLSVFTGMSHRTVMLLFSMTVCG
ncbi:MAG: CHAT domain-containing protein [Richelia sp. SM2_1_7]|nr:CHAT domain-containing protein [Richelia sp. SM2_1_7]